jgi:hypothetical protein
MTKAKIGHGATFKRGDGADPEVFTEIGEVVDVKIPKHSADALDGTHSTSAGKYREFIKGLRQLEEFSLEINLDSTSAEAVTIFGDFSADGARNYQVADVDGSTFTFAALVIGVDAGLPTADKQVVTVDFRPTGIPTMVLATA